MAPTLRDVHMWPDSGWPDERWCPPGRESDPGWPLLEADALLRGSKKVSEVLSGCLAEEGIEMPRSDVWLTAHGRSASGDLEVEVPDGAADGSRSASVRVPVGFHDLDVRRRDALVLLMWRETLTLLVARCGGDPAAVARAADRARRDDHAVLRHGPWKQDRTRSRRMRLVGALHDDGFLHLRIEVEELRGDRATRLSDVLIATTLGWTFDRAARAVRWAPPRAVEGTAGAGVVLEGGGRFDLDPDSGSIRVSGGLAEPLPITPTGRAVPTGFRIVEEHRPDGEAPAIGRADAAARIVSEAGSTDGC